MGIGQKNKEESQVMGIDKKLLEKIEFEASESVKTYMEEDKIGYRHYLYQEMKRKFAEIGIEWEIPNGDSCSRCED